MKIKTSELTGIRLDWAVAAIEYGADQYGKTWGEHAHSKQITVPERKDYIYSPSTNWAQGGPIIDRENLSLERPVRMRGCAVIGFHDWRASHPKNYGGLIRYHGDGPTALIAAMRCFVMSKLGDEVEIPEELA